MKWLQYRWVSRGTSFHESKQRTVITLPQKISINKSFPEKYIDFGHVLAFVSVISWLSSTSSACASIQLAIVKVVSSWPTSGDRLFLQFFFFLHVREKGSHLFIPASRSPRWIHNKPDIYNNVTVFTLREGGCQRCVCVFFPRNIESELKRQ